MIRSPFTLLTVALAALAISATATHAALLLDFNTGNSASEDATAADFTAKGVSGLSGSETVETITLIDSRTNNNNAAGTYTSGGGVEVVFDDSFGSFALDNGQVNNGSGLDAAIPLMRDYASLNDNSAAIDGPINVALKTLGLSANTTYTLHLFGNLDSAFTQNSVFTPLESANPNVTFASTTSGVGGLVVNFTTSAAYVDGTDTVDFNWARDGSETFAVFNGFAIVIPEPATVALLGLGGLVMMPRKRRR